jgi:hypothetical protein
VRQPNDKLRCAIQQDVLAAWEWDGVGWMADGMGGTLTADSGDTYNIQGFSLAKSPLKGGGVTVVDLASFDARLEGGQVVLEWQTKSEIDNLGFDLYRSAHGAPYEKLNPTMIRGLLSSIHGASYSWTDADIAPGLTYFYLLEDIDLNGTRTQHGPVRIDVPGTAPDPDQSQTSDGSGIRRRLTSDEPAGLSLVTNASPRTARPSPPRYTG